MIILRALSGRPQSLNISLTCAMAIYAAIATGRFPEGSLSEAQRIELLARWMMRDVRTTRECAQNYHPSRRKR